jgi:hypothetical protein
MRVTKRDVILSFLLWELCNVLSFNIATLAHAEIITTNVMHVIILALVIVILCPIVLLH